MLGGSLEARYRPPVLQVWTYPSGDTPRNLHFRTEISQTKPSAATLVIEDLQPGTQYSCQGGMLVKVGLRIEDTVEKKCENYLTGRVALFPEGQQDHPAKGWEEWG